MNVNEWQMFLRSMSYLMVFVTVLASVSVQMRNITETLMKPLEKFRKEHLGIVRVMHHAFIPLLLSDSKIHHSGRLLMRPNYLYPS